MAVDASLENLATMCRLPRGGLHTVQTSTSALSQQLACCSGGNPACNSNLFEDFLSLGSLCLGYGLVAFRSEAPESELTSTGRRANSCSRVPRELVRMQ